MPLNQVRFMKTVFAPLLSVFLTTCAGGAGPSAVANTADITASTGPTPDPNALSSNDACGNLLSGDSCISMEFPANSGEFRRLILHLPVPLSPSLNGDDTAKPLMIALHGAGRSGGSPASRLNRIYRFNSFSDDYGYITAIPESTARPSDGNKVWNTLRSADGVANIDDVGFILAIIDKLSAEYAIDMDGINLFGWSNGGFMASRLACEHPEIFASIFTFAGHIRRDLTECSSAGSVAVSYLHGTLDETLPYNGVDGEYFASTYAIEQWAKKNACTLDLVHRESYDFTPDLAGDETDVLEYHDCVLPVQHLRVNGGFHGPRGFDFATFHRVMDEFMKSARPEGVSDRE